MFHWVELRAFVHATEDEEKVVAAMRTLAPEGEVEREPLAGQWGNPIVALAIRVDRTANAKEIWRRLTEALGKAEVLRELGDRLDEDGVYHLRIDKQAAFGGKIERPSGEGDVIDVRAKVAAYPKKRDIALGILRADLETA